jgi:hypothetical protein
VLEFILPILFIIYSLIDTWLENIINIFNDEKPQLVNENLLNRDLHLYKDISKWFSNNNVLSIFYPLILGIKSFSLVFLFILIRASYPRLRFDKLMSCCWTELLPLTIAIILFVPCISFLYNIIIYNVHLI